MTLRTEFHAAFDSLNPVLLGLDERVVQQVLVQREHRPAGAGAFLRLRAPLSLVAVLVLIAIVVGVLMGSRLLSDWRIFHQQTVHVGLDQKQLRQLEARPLHLPALKAGVPCGGPWDPTTGWYGSGPVHLVFGTSGGADTEWGSYSDHQAAARPGLSGPILVRARVLGVDHPVIFVGDYASGVVVGADTVRGRKVQQYSELVLDASHPPASRTGEFITWTFTAGAVLAPAARPASFVPPVVCVAWQVDGLDFTETFVTSGLSV